MKQVQNIKSVFSPFLLIYLFTAFFTSCQKELSHKLPESPDLSESLFGVEQAYPGIKGELLTTKFNGIDIIVEKKMDRYVWMGDIAFDQQTFDSLRKAENAENRTFKPTLNNHWTRGEVFFRINAGFTAAEQTTINNAINQWRNNTSLRFTPRTTQTNFIQIVRGNPGSGLFSDFVGMKGGMQTINLQGGAFNVAAVIHEIGHAIGFYHEQSRTDRNNAIIINWNNIRPGAVHNFRTYTELGMAGAQIGNFDFNSIMLYPSIINDPNFVFNTTIPTMTRLNGTIWNPAVILSAGDIETAVFIYGPPFARLVYHQISIIEEYGQFNEFVREEGGYTINFFADAACTIPATLAQQRTIGYYAYSSSYTGGILQTITLQPGQSAYDIPTGYYYEYRSEYGNTVYYQSNSAGPGLEGYWR